jgi:hypothetical protein
MEKRQQQQVPVVVVGKEEEEENVHQRNSVRFHSVFILLFSLSRRPVALEVSSHRLSSSSDSSGRHAHC